MPTIKATLRELVGRKNYSLRDQGRVPAVVYGPKNEPKNIAVDRNEITKLYKEAGESTLVALEIEGEKEPINVLLQDFQIDPLRDEITHFDFRAVDMSKPIEADVKLKFVGEAPAVKALGGTLVRSMDTVAIKALPKDLVTTIEVDLTQLATFDDGISVSELPIPEGVEILSDANASIAVVLPPRSEEEMAALDTAVEADVSAVQVEGDKKEEGEEAPAEGEGKKEGAGEAKSE